MDFYPLIFREVQGTFCYQTMTPENWNWILNFISNGSQSLQAYDEYKKVEIDENGCFKITNRRIAMHHRMQIGTIVGDAVLNVKFISGGYIGTIEEWFISKLKPGDTFSFAGKKLEYFRVKDMQVFVRKADPKKNRAP
jgi:ATP-dependent Lhr-like helicase